MTKAEIIDSIYEKVGGFSKKNPLNLLIWFLIRSRMSWPMVKKLRFQVLETLSFVKKSSASAVTHRLEFRCRSVHAVY